MKYGFVVILASLALVGCGGGNSVDRADLLHTSDLPYAPINSLILHDEGEESYRRAIYSSVAQHSTHYLRGDRLVWEADGQGPTRTTFECDGPQCVESGFMLSTPRSWYPAEKLVMLRRVNGVARVIESFINPESPLSYHTYGGWMEQATFVSLSYLLGGEDNPGAGNRYIYSVAMGISNGQNPDVSLDGATWQGIVVGRDHTVLDSLGYAVTGEAYVTLNSGDDGLEADVWFTRLHNVEARLKDMRWTGLPLQEGGFGRRDAENDWIAGQFFGDRHEEVAGVFERAGVNGAFGGRN